LPIHQTTIFAYFILFIAPAFFTTNVIFGRQLLSVEPFTLAFLRWGLTSLILLAFCKNDWSEMKRVYKANKILSYFCGFLAFWICGGMVYFALHYTSATNGILIYTTPPILILAIEAIWRGRPITLREVIGISIALVGAAIIIANGKLNNLLNLQFNKGDLIFVLAAISWAVYSVLLKSDKYASLSTLPLLTLLSICGTITLLPFAAYEIIYIGGLPTTQKEWILIAGIILIASIGAFLCFQYGIKTLGAPIAGIFMYLLPPWGLFFAWAFLNEKLEQYHIIATVSILSGIIIATLPLKLFKRKKPSQ